MNSDSIPIDLILEILSRLPLKSVARFRCVSKQWASTLGRPYFKDLFLTRSSAKPCLLLAVEKNGTWSFFSLPHRHNPYHYSSSSLVVAAEFQTKFPGDDMWIPHATNLKSSACGYASGLIYFNSVKRTSIKEDKTYHRPVIFNPNMDQYMTLPSLESYLVSSSYSFFGFDPIDNQFKVLFMAYPYGPDDDHRIITLGTGMRWRKIECNEFTSLSAATYPSHCIYNLLPKKRKIECSLRHHKKSEGICINGVLYYLGETCDYVDAEEAFEEDDPQLVIVCFDVRCEKFKFIDVERHSYELINYKGKLGLVYNYYTHDNNVIELGFWVLENMEKQEWSKHAYALSEDQFFHRRHVNVVGATAWGEIVFSMGTYELPFYVFYFNPERKTFQSVEIQGFGEDLMSRLFMQHVYTFVDHVEDLNVRIRFEKKKAEKEKIETIVEEWPLNH